MFLRSVQVQAFEDAIENDLRVVANGVKDWTDGDIYVELNTALCHILPPNGDMMLASMANILSSQQAYCQRNGTGT